MGHPHDDAPLVDALTALIRAIVREELAALAPSPSPSPSPFMTVVEVAEYLQTSRARVDGLLSSGQLPRVKDGGRTLIRRADLQAWLGELPKGPAEGRRGPR